MQTERVTFLTSREHKKALDAYASSRGESVGNVVREATARYIAHPPDVKDDEEAELAAIIAEVVKAVPEMQASLRRSTKMLEQSRLDLDRKLRAAGVRK